MRGSGRRPLDRGNLTIWAAAAIYAIGSVNFLFDRAQKPFMTDDQLSALTGVPKSTLAANAKLIRDTLKLRQFDPEFSRRELIESSPVAWLVEVSGLVVDARTLPLTLQNEARRRGLIPEIALRP